MRHFLKHCSASANGRAWCVLAAAVVLLHAALATADVDTEGTATAASATPAATEITPEAFAALQARMEKSEAEVAELKTWREQQEESALEEETMVNTGFTPSLSVYGFMDLTLWRMFIKDDNVMNVFLHQPLSFTLTHLNLYIYSRMSRSATMLAEVQFTYLPQGRETFFKDGLPNYSQEDTTVRMPSTGETFELGGVAIERAQFAWQHWDWLGVTAGHFITPYGIWNVEHGSPVVIPMFAPFITTHAIIPRAQTGLMIQGQFYPWSDGHLSYALTVSNNRGKADEIVDWSDNKALGLNLKLAHEAPKFRISLGSSGYWGHSKSITKKLISQGPVLVADVQALESYTEAAFALDFLLELYGVRFQAEYAQGVVFYDARPPITAPFLNVVTEGYPVDHRRSDFYALLAYTLPLEQLLGEMTLTPFFLLEQSVDNDMDKSGNIWCIRGGLNFRPAAFVVIKIEGSRLWAADSPYIQSPAYQIGGQVAVAF